MEEKVGDHTRGFHRTDIEVKFITYIHTSLVRTQSNGHTQLQKSGGRGTVWLCTHKERDKSDEQPLFVGWAII